ncbi:DUF6470 family protein [Effusibacillus pohliae]|uniref:DUF6470 family protein n=1 Tax=Effusibacillus pohliae TaxID=232270 RepID=UPI0012E9ACF5|nr:DUF6470 family protein [Effusibacillus pohliae]
MRLEIHQTFGRIGLNIKRPEVVLNPDTPPLELEIAHPWIEIKRNGYSELHIDQSACFSDMGLKPPSEIGRQMYEWGQRDIMEGIARIVDEGNALGAIEMGQTIGDVARSAGDQPVEVTVAAVPSHRPEIQVVYHPPDIEVHLGEVKVRYRPWTVNTEVQLGSVRTYMTQYPSIQITAVGSVFDTRV